MDALIQACRGQVIRPGDADYERARHVYNAGIDRKPTAIVTCADVADVMAAVKYAGEHQLPVAVRGGGHSAPGFGTCDDGIVVDLSRLKGIRVDPERRTVRAGGGCTWGDVDHATQAFGLATPGGIISTTGIAGLTLGGGFGYLSRLHGLACDNLTSADVVTGDGNLVVADRNHHPDLFWAIRGGGGNFGVLTSLEYQLHPLRTMFAGPIFYPPEQAAGAMRLYREFMRTAPREMSAFFAFLIVPPGPPFPQALWNQTVPGIMCSYAGDPAQGEKLTARLRDFGPPLAVLTHEVPYTRLQSIFDPLLPPGLHHYWKSEFTRDLSDELIAAHVKFGPQVPTMHSAVHIYPLDGAIHDVAAADTAFAYRDVKFVHIVAAVTPDANQLAGYRAWVREYWSALHPYSAGGTYVNFLMEEGPQEVSSAYRDNHARLGKIKARYDPENRFCINQNIQPRQTV